MRHGAVAFSRGVQPSVYALLAVRLTDLFCDEPSLFPQPEGQLSSGNSSTTIDTSSQGAGTLFGLAVKPPGTGVYFVDDGDNTLDLLH